ASHLKEAVLIEDELHELSHIEDLAAGFRHDADQLLRHPVGGIGRLCARCKLPDVAGEIAEEPADLAEGVRFISRDIGGNGVAAVNIGTTELFFRDLYIERALDQRRAGDQKLRRLACHHGEMRGCKARRREARDGAKRGGSDRNFAEQLRNREKARLLEYGIADGPAAFSLGDAAARTFKQTHEGDAILRGKLFGVDAFPKARRVGRAALQREILPADGDRAAVDQAKPGDVIGGGEAGEVTRLIALGGAGDAAMLAETPLVENTVNPLANGKAALGMLGADRVHSALGQGGSAHGADVFGFFFPTHILSPRKSDRAEYSGWGPREIGRLAKKAGSAKNAPSPRRAVVYAGLRPTWYRVRG